MLHGRTFRLFVSSTFSDLKAERNALSQFVFPRLRELCSRHGCQFQAIDLRWGISSEAGLDQQTVPICIEEVRRCQATTPKPNFIILLGDRYGWRPLPSEIPADEFLAVERHIPREDHRALLREWYRRDDNSVPPAFCLQPRTGRYAESRIWRDEVEAPLHAILAQASAAAGLAAEARMRYTASATAQEIAQGVLRVPDAEEHVFAFFRHIALPDGTPPQKIRSTVGTLRAFVDADDAGHIDGDAVHALGDLKSRLRSRLQDHVYTYQSEWTGDGITEKHIGALPSSLDDCLALLDNREGQPATLCADVWRALARIILDQVQELSSVDPLEEEVARHADFGAERARHFVGRESLLRGIGTYLHGSARHPLVLYGESGTGKTALVAQAERLCRQGTIEGRKAVATGVRPVVVSRFVGATPASSDVRALLDGICREVCRRYGTQGARIPDDYRELIEKLPKLLGVASQERPLWVFIDALDQLRPVHAGAALSWLPTELPPNVHLVLSALSVPEIDAPPADSVTATDEPETPHTDSALDELRHMVPPEGLTEVTRLDEGAAGSLLDAWLGDVDRALQPHQRHEVLTKFAASGRPLYLRVAFEEARRWRSYSDPGQTVLASDIKGIIRSMIERLASPDQHGFPLVSKVLRCLAASRGGLAESELLDLLARDDDYWAHFVRHARHDLPQNASAERKLPVIVWSRLLHDLEPYLAESSDGESVLLTFYHRQVQEVAASDFLRSHSDRLAAHHALAGYFTSRGHAYRRTLLNLVYHTAQAAWAEWRLLGEDAETTHRNSLYALMRDEAFRTRQLQATDIYRQSEDDLRQALDVFTNTADTDDGIGSPDDAAHACWLALRAGQLDADIQSTGPAAVRKGWQGDPAEAIRIGSLVHDPSERAKIWFILLRSQLDRKDVSGVRVVMRAAKEMLLEGVQTHLPSTFVRQTLAEMAGLSPEITWEPLWPIGPVSGSGFAEDAFPLIATLSGGPQYETYCRECIRLAFHVEKPDALRTLGRIFLDSGDVERFWGLVDREDMPARTRAWLLSWAAKTEHGVDRPRLLRMLDRAGCAEELPYEDKADLLCRAAELISRVDENGVVEQLDRAEQAAVQIPPLGQSFDGLFDPRALKLCDVAAVAARSGDPERAFRLWKLVLHEGENPTQATCDAFNRSRFGHAPTWYANTCRKAVAHSIAQTRALLPGCDLLLRNMATSTHDDSVLRAVARAYRDCGDRGSSSRFFQQVRDLKELEREVESLASGCHVVEAKRLLVSIDPDGLNRAKYANGWERTAVEVAVACSREGDIDGARDLLDRVFRRAETSPLPGILNEGHLAEAAIRAFPHDWNQRLEQFFRQIRYHGHNNRKKRSQAHILRDAALGLMKCGEREVAQQYLSAALTVAESVQDEEFAVCFYRLAGVSHGQYDQHSHKRMAEYLEEAKPWRDIPEARALIDQGIADVPKDRGLSSLVTELFLLGDLRAGLDLVPTLGQYSDFVALTEMAVLLQLEPSPTARDALVEALQLAASLPDVRRRTATCTELACALAACGDTDGARQALLCTLKRAQSAESHSDRLRAATRLSVALSDGGEGEKAVEVVKGCLRSFASRETTGDDGPDRQELHVVEDLCLAVCQIPAARRHPEAAVRVEQLVGKHFNGEGGLHKARILNWCCDVTGESSPLYDDMSAASCLRALRSQGIGSGEATTAHFFRKVLCKIAIHYREEERHQDPTFDVGFYQLMKDYMRGLQGVPYAGLRADLTRETFVALTSSCHDRNGAVAAALCSAAFAREGLQAEAQDALERGQAFLCRLVGALEKCQPTSELAVALGRVSGPTAGERAIAEAEDLARLATETEKYTEIAKAKLRSSVLVASCQAGCSDDFVQQRLSSLISYLDRITPAAKRAFPVATVIAALGRAKQYNHARRVYNYGLSVAGQLEDTYDAAVFLEPLLKFGLLALPGFPNRSSLVRQAIPFVSTAGALERESDSLTLVALELCHAGDVECALDLVRLPDGPCGDIDCQLEDVVALLLEECARQDHRCLTEVLRMADPSHSLARLDGTSAGDVERSIESTGSWRLVEPQALAKALGRGHGHGAFRNWFISARLPHAVAESTVTAYVDGALTSIPQERIEWLQGVFGDGHGRVTSSEAELAATIRSSISDETALWLRRVLGCYPFSQQSAYRTVRAFQLALVKTGRIEAYERLCRECPALDPRAERNDRSDQE